MGDNDVTVLLAPGADALPERPAIQESPRSQHIRACCGRRVACSSILGGVCILSIVLILFAFLPAGIIELRRFKEAMHVQAWFAAGVFCFLAIPISIFDIAQHLRHWYQPQLQRHVVRIMWMVPVYAIDSWFALRFKEANIYLDTARECYEAYVIYNFYMYLLTYLRMRPDFDASLEGRPSQKQPFPFCCLPAWKMGPGFIRRCTHGVAGYVVVRCLTTIIAFICELTDTYHEGVISAKGAYVYLAVITNLSQAVAMYCLVMFYMAFKKDMKAVKPFGKFVTIKLVVFFSFWQSILIAILAHYDVIPDNKDWVNYTQQAIAAGLQDFIVCFEMFLGAIAHHYVFSYREHLPEGVLGPHAKMTFRRSVKELFDVRDVAGTVYEHVGTVATIGGRIGPVPRDPHSALSSPRKALLADDTGQESSGYGAAGGGSQPRSEV